MIGGKGELLPSKNKLQMFALRNGNSVTNFWKKARRVGSKAV